jgi:DNA-binding PadR family transcriptional regulator
VRSRVNWAVLSLVIERPSYGYELSQRFDRRFGGLMDVGRSHIYAALNALQQETFIEPLPLEITNDSQRAPKVHYRATAKGAGAFRHWLAEQLRDDSERAELLDRLIAAVATRPAAMLDLVDAYERACLEDASAVPLSERAAAETSTPAQELMRRLVRESRRYALEADLQWVGFAREEIRAFLDQRERRAG